MEEDLKRIECLIERCNQCKLNACITCDICWSEVQAIENLISALHKANKEKHNQKNLRRFNERKYRKALSDYRQLLKRYKELEEEVESQDKTIDNLIECQTEREKYTTKLEQDNLILANENLNSIPISVIQNKLEKFKREFDFYAGREHFEWQDGEFDGEVCDDISLKIGVLKEILEERNK